jgi:hypothetical protein
MSQHAVPPRVAAVPQGPATSRNQQFVAMTVQRQLYLRDNAAHKLGRSEYDSATLAHVVGEERNPACTRCQRGHGPFLVCVTVRGHFGNMCTNCKYQGAYSECSFRPGRSNTFLNCPFSYRDRSAVICTQSTSLCRIN